MKIAVAGTGYVGLSIATLLAQHNEVVAVDIIPEKVDLINNKKSPIQDDYIEQYLAEKELNLRATLDAREAYAEADFVVIAAPTNYDSQKNFFDTSAVEKVIDLVLDVNPDAIMVIKSTIPVGYCRSLYAKYAMRFLTETALKGNKFNLLFSPEFLRESKALYDNLYPSRIIVGVPKLIENYEEENRAIAAIADVERLTEAAHTFAELLKQGALKDEIDVLFMGLKEAEAVKLFANTYLALREKIRQNNVKEAQKPGSSKEDFEKRRRENAERRAEEKRIERARLKIEKLEAELTALDEELFGSAASDYVRAAEIDKRKTEIEEELLELYELVM